MICHSVINLLNNISTGEYEYVSSVGLHLGNTEIEDKPITDEGDSAGAVIFYMLGSNAATDRSTLAHAALTESALARIPSLEPLGHTFFEIRSLGRSMARVVLLRLLLIKAELLRCPPRSERRSARKSR
jgi:hypothetical protein